MKGHLQAIVLLIIGIYYLPLTAQTNEPCATQKLLEERFKQFPQLKQQFEERDRRYKDQTELVSKRQRQVVTIPVVVHVVHDGDSVSQGENVSDSQIRSQIEVLNEDFRRLNDDASNTPPLFQPIAADFEINFELAKRDPDGFPTSGIERIDGGVFNWDIGTFETFKPSTIWDRSKYLNIWVARLGGADQSTLGYAQFPGMADSTDGIVIDYVAFGTEGNSLLPVYNLGRTTTHEVGHWLGLYHVWGDDDGLCPGDLGGSDDFVDDTPPQADKYFGCPPWPQISCDTFDMFMNYMDYSNDACSNLFTEGQKARINNFLANERSSNLDNDRLEYAQYDLALTKLLLPTEQTCINNFQPSFVVRNLGTETVTSLLVNYQIDGGALIQDVLNDSIAFNQSKILRLPTMNFIQGSHSLLVFVTNPNNNLDQNQGNEEASLQFDVVSIGIGENIPAQPEGFEATSLPNLWSLDNPDNDRSWQPRPGVGAEGSQNCFFFNNFSGSSISNPRGTRDGLITPDYDFRSTTYPKLHFDVAYARRSIGTQDSLIIYYSLDCGASWERFWNVTPNQLASAPITATQFVPDSSQWKHFIASPYLAEGFAKVSFKFENVSDWGNNIYLDNIWIDPVTIGVGIEAVNPGKLTIYPNPNEGRFIIDVNAFNGNKKSTLRVFNTVGKLVYSEDVRFHEAKHIVELPELSKGLYFITVTQDERHYSSKLMIK